jgi:hypothetical protein
VVDHSGYYFGTRNGSPCDLCTSEDAGQCNRRVDRVLPAQEFFEVAQLDVGRQLRQPLYVFNTV